MNCYTKFFRPHALVRRYFSAHISDSFVDRQRLFVYVYATLAAWVLITLNLLGISGYQGPYYFATNALQFVLVTVLFVLFCRRKLSLHKAFNLLVVVTQGFCLTEMLYNACIAHRTDVMMVVSNLILLMIILLMTIVAYLHYAPYWCVGTALATYAVCCWVMEEPILYRLFGVFVFVFLLIAVLGSHLAYQLEVLTLEHRSLERTEKEIISLLHTDKENLRDYISQAKQQGLTAEQTERLLGILLSGDGKEAQRNLQNNIAYWYEQSQIDYEHLDELFPSLSASELSICKLVLQGYKLKEMCELLGKTESNVTCQRSNIRAKLGLKRGDDLRACLLEMSKIRGGGVDPTLLVAGAWDPDGGGA